MNFEIEPLYGMGLLHFRFAYYISFALHLKNLPGQHEMHATSRFKCHGLHLHFMK